MSDVAHGVVIGIVEDLDDPDGLARIKVRLPHLAGEPSDWVRLAQPMAGRGRGTFFRPERDDEVLLVGEHGDPRRMYVIGSLWSIVDAPPEGMGRAADNAIRAIVSRSGHRVVLDDTPGGERIQIVDGTGEQSVLVEGSKITVEAGRGTVEISASGDVSISAGGNLTLRAKDTLTITGNAVKIN